jgi:PAS domain S-box-containing protein
MAGDSRLLSGLQEDLPGILAQDMRSVPYFRQLYLLDETGTPVAGYPEANFERIEPTPEEQTGIQLALRGVSIQTYTVPPLKNEGTAQISFLASVHDGTGQVKGVLLGRSDLATNPFTKPIIQAFQEMKDTGPESTGGVNGMILDENRRILYHPNSTRVMTTYLGKTSVASGFYDETGPDGTRNLVFFQPTMGRSWAVVLAVPAQRAQQLALTIAVPMLIMILFLAIVAIISLRLGLRVVTASLETLAFEAGRISQGQLDHTLPVHGVDEVGRLSQAFEQMRVSLKARLEELNRLLSVSQGVASSLEMKDTVRPILDAALSGSAWSARVVLTPDPVLESEISQETHFGLGMATDDYAYLDDQLLALSRTHDRLVLPNLTRGKGLTFPSGKPRPGAILAVALRRENQYFGSLWIAYDRPKVFSEEEIRFLITLAGEAALAAANARLYSTAEIGRQRLGAILASTPDPVFVTDHQNRLLLTNPAAEQLPGLSGVVEIGKPVDKLIDHPGLLGMLIGDTDNSPTRELSLGNSKVYYTTVSSVVVEGQAVGKICILRDITHFKQLDTLKSDFVATVSHDLRSPLTLMRGYATMLQMVGELNDQQKGYVRKIITGVESMSRLVNNLLDLGRIEAGVGLQVETIGLAEVVDRVVNSLQLQAAQKNIQISRDLPEAGDTSIEVDPALFQQGLYNLVENAVKYTPVGGRVEVQGKIVDGLAIFEVRDNGIGIAPLDQPRLFEKFYRGGQREAYMQRGSGLGLAIVKSIVERHGGRIWVESTLGKGSVFSVEIPVRRGITESVGPGVLPGINN